jgi:hypothetical protein
MTKPMNGISLSSRACVTYLGLPTPRFLTPNQIQPRSEWVMISGASSRAPISPLFEDMTRSLVLSAVCQRTSGPVTLPDSVEQMLKYSHSSLENIVVTIAILWIDPYVVYGSL